MFTNVTHCGQKKGIKMRQPGPGVLFINSSLQSKQRGHFLCFFPAMVWVAPGGLYCFLSQTVIDSNMLVGRCLSRYRFTIIPHYFRPDPAICVLYARDPGLSNIQNTACGPALHGRAHKIQQLLDTGAR